MSTRNLSPERRKEIAVNAARARHDPNKRIRCAATGLKFTTTNYRVQHREYDGPICRIVATMLKRVTRRQFEKIAVLIVKQVQASQKKEIPVDLLRTPRAINSGE